MTSYERVLTALRHKEPDRVPFDLGASVLTGMNVHAYRALRRYLGLPETETQILDAVQQIVRVEDDVIDLFNVDVRGVRPEPIAVAPMRVPERLDATGKYREMTDELGVRWHMPVKGGQYFDMVSHPLAEAETLEDLGRYEFPSGSDPS